MSSPMHGRIRTFTPAARHFSTMRRTSEPGALGMAMMTSAAPASIAWSATSSVRPSTGTPRMRMSCLRASSSTSADRHEPERLALRLANEQVAGAAGAGDEHARAAMVAVARGAADERRSLEHAARDAGAGRTGTPPRSRGRTRAPSAGCRSTRAAGRAAGRCSRTRRRSARRARRAAAPLPCPSRSCSATSWRTCRCATNSATLMSATQPIVANIARS